MFPGGLVVETNFPPSQAGCYCSAVNHWEEAVDARDLTVELMMVAGLSRVMGDCCLYFVNL